MPKRVALAIRQVWSSMPGFFLLTVGLQILDATGTAAVVFASRDALTVILAAGENGGSLSDVVPKLVPIGIVGVFRFFMSTVRLFQNGYVQERIAADAQSRLIRTATGIDLRTYEDPAFYDRFERAKRGAMGSWNLVTQVTGMFGNVLTIAAVVTALYSFHPMLVVLVAVGAIPPFFLGRLSSRRDLEFDQSMNTDRRRVGYLWSVLIGRDAAQEMRAYSLGEGLEDLWATRSLDLVHRSRAHMFKQHFRSLVTRLVSGSCNSVTLGFALWLLFTGRIETAATGAALYAIQATRGQMSGLLGGINGITRAGVYHDEYERFVALGKETVDNDQLRPPPPPFEVLDVENLTFSYPGASRPALEDVSVTIKAGEIVALVGENGSGKTTLAKLLAHLYPPSSGRILWNGVDARELSASGMRDSIAVIFQDFVKYKLTALDNVGFGRINEMDDADAVIEAAKRSGADNFLSKLPLGYDTLLSRSYGDGRELSVGQWQRMALARAFFREAPIIILDEPTSALDPRAEYELFQRIRRLCAGKTVLLISHRFSSVRNADRIVVLDQGRVVEQGTHTDLMASDSLYAELFTMQASAYLDGLQLEEAASSSGRPSLAKRVEAEVRAEARRRVRLEKGLRSRSAGGDAEGFESIEADDAPPVPSRRRRRQVAAEILKQDRMRLAQLLPMLARSFRWVWSVAPGVLTVSMGLKVLQATGAAASLLASQSALSAILGGVEEGSGFSDVLPKLAPIALVAAYSWILQTINMVQNGYIRERITMLAQRRMLRTARSVDLRSYEEPEFYDRLQRASNGSSGAWQLVDSVLSLFGSVLTLLAVSATLYSFHPVLVVLVVISALPVFINAHTFARRNFDFQKAWIAPNRRLNYIWSLLTGRDEAKEMRAFDLGPELELRWRALNLEILRARRKMAIQQHARGAVTRVFSSMLNAVSVGVALWLLFSGRLATASAGAALLGINAMRGQTQGFLGGISSVFNTGLFLDEYERFLELGESKVREIESLPKPPPFSTLEARGVGFHYPGSTTPALQDVSITIKAGEVIALVGENGSGKTTLAKVLAQLYTPTEGAVFWDGVDATTLHPDGMRDSISVIFQDFMRYQLTVRENIGFGRIENVEDVDRVVASAERSGADRIVAQLPKGYDSILSRQFSRGNDLSVGQWQRIALARGFFRDASMIILDEPTAALDPRAERDLFDKIQTLCQGKTVLLISHRFSSVRNADRIIVLDKGRIVEQGPHDQLMAEGGLYAELFTLQATAYLHGMALNKEHDAGLEGASEQPASMSGSTTT